jgi:hypothetical protein
MQHPVSITYGYVEDVAGQQTDYGTSQVADSDI